MRCVAAVRMRVGLRSHLRPDWGGVHRPPGSFQYTVPWGLPGRGFSSCWLQLLALGPSPNSSSRHAACFSQACQRESPGKMDARICPGSDVTAFAVCCWLEASRGPTHSRGSRSSGHHRIHDTPQPTLPCLSPHLECKLCEGGRLYPVSPDPRKGE